MRQHPNVKLLRAMLRELDANGALSAEALRWSIGVAENVVRLVHGQGRQPEANYRRLEEAVRGE